ncbi:PREDICTED: uncharacterized protein LOC109173336 isoform X2 [Ipomoea nil]|uniref:uncharacterized protein LOC109173336 isoform X2 n=1 Tax=Ipomoea nil TaxID=35883 RepID=UPI00090155D7|nr:PREDICTED: uncharacterized protein LOC109173336 isoform X2 [Ipomoea nil]
MAKHGKFSIDAKARTKTKHMRRRKKISKGRKCEAQGLEHQDFELLRNSATASASKEQNVKLLRNSATASASKEQNVKHDRTLMSQHNNKRKGKGIALPQSEELILQPPSMTILEEDHMQIQMIPTPPNIVRRELHDTDSERTISTGPSTSNSYMAGGPSRSSSELSSRNKTFIHPIGNTTFEPSSVHTNIMPCINRIFPEAVNTFKTAPQHLKDVWFNEFKKRHEWDPNDEDTVRMIFEKKAAKLLADALSDVRTRLASGNGVPGWISDPVLAQYHVIWNSNEFKKISEKNKRNRNSDCGGIGPSLHTAGSIPITEHRRRLKEKLGKEPTYTELFNATHTLKRGGYVCRKAQKVIETVTELKQKQPEMMETTVWLKATGGVRKGGVRFRIWVGYPTLLPGGYDTPEIKDRAINFTCILRGSN